MSKKKDDEKKALALAISRRLGAPKGELTFDPTMGLELAKPYVWESVQDDRVKDHARGPSVFEMELKIDPADAAKFWRAMEDMDKGTRHRVTVDLEFEPLSAGYAGIDYGASDDQVDALMWGMHVPGAADIPPAGTFSNTCNAGPLTAERIREAYEAMASGWDRTYRGGDIPIDNREFRNGKPVIDVVAVCASCKGKSLKMRDRTLAEVERLGVDGTWVMCRACGGWMPPPKELTP